VRRKRRSIALLAAATISIAAAGCGAEDAPNDPRPPAPIELSAVINGEEVVVSPEGNEGALVGAGLANFTISNQTADAIAIDFDGPSQLATDEVVPNGTLNYKIELIEGIYTVGASDPAIESAELVVGPERESAQNDLLLP
jgi:hypothetical protein